MWEEIQEYEDDKDNMKRNFLFSSKYEKTSYIFYPLNIWLYKVCTS
jgi:hypothetical protein